jgi:hypothetical protein
VSGFSFFFYFVGGLGGERRRGGSFCGSSSSLSFLPCISTLYSTLPSTLRCPRRVLVGSFSPLTRRLSSSGLFSFCLFTCDISHLRVVPARHVLGYAQRCPSSLCTMCARAYRTSYILSIRGVGGRQFCLVAFFFFERTGRVFGVGHMGLSSLESEIVSAFDDFVFWRGVFFWRGILISGCFWRYKYATPCACARALLVYFIFPYLFFPIFWRF